jgi:putative protein-disulfide isomerase
MRLLYVFDALCGWCYGFRAVMDQLHDEFSSSLPFEVISGGMVLGNQAGPIGQVAGYISEAYKKVEERTGVKFGQDFLEGTLKDGQVIFDSYPPAKALRIFKEFKPKETVQFASDIQSAIYFDGIDPCDFEIYSQLIVKYGISKQDFKILWNSTDYDVRTREEFILARQLNVSGYPTVFFEAESQYHKIASGYTPFSVLRDRLEHIMRLAESK